MLKLKKVQSDYWAMFTLKKVNRAGQMVKIIVTILIDITRCQVLHIT